MLFYDTVCMVFHTVMTILDTFSGFFKLHPDSSWKWHISHYCKRNYRIRVGFL